VWLDTNVWRENNCIRRDEFHAGELAVTKIADAGYRRMICLRRPHADNAHYSYKDRLAGVNASASQSGVSIEEFVLPWRPDEAAEVLPGFLRSLKNDVAVLALDIYMVQEIASWLLREGIRPGKDFPLACCDDGFHGSANWQMLSRVSFSRFEMGIQAAQIMIHGFENPENPFPSQQQRGQWQKGHTLPVLHNS
jgi:DNA-binding LacI/PurR family transcriptional regulator